VWRPLSYLLLSRFVARCVAASDSYLLYYLFTGLLCLKLCVRGFDDCQLMARGTWDSVSLPSCVWCFEDVDLMIASWWRGELRISFTAILCFYSYCLSASLVYHLISIHLAFQRPLIFMCISAFSIYLYLSCLSTASVNHIAFRLLFFHLLSASYLAAPVLNREIKRPSAWT
jgi:hypothetical protein